MKFNDMEMPSWFRIIDIYGRGIASRNLDLVSVPGMHGAHLNEVITPPKYLEIKVRIDAKDKLELSERIDEINAILDVQEPVPIVFPDEPNWTYYGIPEIASDEGRKTFFARDTITIVCPDPYKYGPEKVLEFPSDLVMVNNEGAEDTFPVYEMTVTAPITFAMIQNHLEESMLIGEPASEDVSVINQKELVYQDSGEKIAEWTNGAIAIDNINNQIVAGDMGTDGTGFIATDYGSHNYGHGPAINRELPETVQDFEVEAIFETRNETPQENFRTELYLFDENVNMLGKIGVNDNTAQLHRRRAHGRVGEHTSMSSSRYVINPNNYEYEGKGLTQFFMRMTRIGHQFTFYIARIDNRGRHVNTLNRSLRLNNSDYQGRLKFLQLYIRTFDNRPVSLARINSVSVYKRNKVEVDQTPYIAYPGDVITFDTQTEEMLINGEDAMVHKDFISEFFSLKKGENTLGVLPENALDVQMRFKERRI